jgi:hypothetical protein
MVWAVAARNEPYGTGPQNFRRECGMANFSKKKNSHKNSFYGQARKAQTEPYQTTLPEPYGAKWHTWSKPMFVVC